MTLQLGMAIETTRELFRVLVAHGADKQQLVELADIDLKKLEKSDQRYPVADHLNLWKTGESLLPLSAIGFKMGAKSDPYNRGIIVGLIFTASANLEQAVTNKIRYTKILADHISLQFDKSGDEFSITYSILEG